MILEAEASKQAAILKAEAEKQKRIKEAEGQAEAIRTVQKATAEGIEYIKEAGADEAVLTLKSLEAFARAADGKATKIIIPSDLQGIAGLTKTIAEVARPDVTEKGGLIGIRRKSCQDFGQKSHNEFILKMKGDIDNRITAGTAEKDAMLKGR